MNPDYILLTGIKDPKRLEDYFASNLIDVAYVESLSSRSVKILVEPDTNLRKEEDVNWILELVVDALKKNDEDKFSTEIVLAANVKKKESNQSPEPIPQKRDRSP